MIKNPVFRKSMLLGVACIAINCYAQDNRKKLPLTLPDIWNGTFNERVLKVHTSKKENKIGFIQANAATNWEGICLIDFGLGKIIDTVFTNQIITSGDSIPITLPFFDDFEFSPDDNNILIKTQVESAFSISEKSFDYVWNRQKRTLKTVSPDGKQMYATFSPDGTMLAFVRDGNLYIKRLDNDQVIAVTYDGASGDALNGMADMLYENGFGITKAFEWAPNSKSIAFLRLNESTVKHYPITNFNRNYPDIRTQRYPMPGEAIPEPQVFVYQIPDKILTKVDVGLNPNQYIVGFKWHPGSENLYVQQLNRTQNRLNILNANVINAKTEWIFTDSSKQYVSVVPDNIYPVASRKTLLWLSERDGFRHIYEMKENGDSIRQITKGNYEDFDVTGVNEENGEIYFTSNQASSRQKNLYKVNFDGTAKKRLTDDEDGWHKSWLSVDKQYFFDEMSTLNSPASYRMYTIQGKPLYKKFIDNKVLRETLKKYTIPEVEFFNFRKNDSLSLNAYLIKPTREGQKLPLLFYIYGGNSKNEVTDQWTDKQTLTMRYLAEQGYYVVCVDPRGTPGKGANFRNANYGQPGQAEMEDILALKKYITTSMGLNIDTAKTAIVGWSYGGFLAALAQTKYAGQFKAAVAIAPVTNWRLYDNVYTERLLQMPSENAVNYKKYSPVNFVDNYIDGLFIIHGTADDIVHLNNSMELSKVFTDAGKPFEQHFYPDKTHSLTDNPPNATRVDLFRRIDKFLKESFRIK